MPVIPLSPAAEAQLGSLEAFYEKKDRPAAIFNLVSTLNYVTNPDNLSRLRFFDAPRPYPKIKIPGVSWTIQNGYWFGFNLTEPMQIVAVI